MKLNLTPLAGAALAAAALLAGCASPPPTEPALTTSAKALDTARSAGAQEYATAELAVANSKLEQARTLAAAGKAREALRLAEQAEVDAQYARAHAATERSARALGEVEASLRTLREELNRSATAIPVRP
jgi:uncharacterized sporulation protein YeaH/YhbH (DUF444 family)